MVKRVVLIVLIILSISQINGWAGEFFGAAPQGTPSVLNYGWEGLTLGLGLGLSAGYLSYLNSDNHDDISLGAAYGSIIGTGIGLMLGFQDVKKGKKGYGAIILRDMHLGGNLGLAVGAAYGVIAWTKKDKSKYFGESVAWGYIVGAIVGLGIGTYEGPMLVGEANDDTSQNKRLIQNVAFLFDSQNRPCPGYQIAYKF